MSDEKPVAHVDLNLYLDIHNRAYDLLPMIRNHDKRVEVVDAIFSLVREYAPIIMEAARNQAEAERLLGSIIAQRVCPACGTYNPEYGQPDNCRECATSLSKPAEETI